MGVCTVCRPSVMGRVLIHAIFIPLRKVKTANFRFFFKSWFSLGVKQGNSQQKLSKCKRRCKEITLRGKRRRGYKTREMVGLRAGLCLRSPPHCTNVLPSGYLVCIPAPLSTDYSGNKAVALEITPLAQCVFVTDGNLGKAT